MAELDCVHTIQSINLLKATNLHVCVLLDVGNRCLEIQKIAH